MWTAESAPRRGKTPAVMPTKALVPTLPPSTTIIEDAAWVVEHEKALDLGAANVRTGCDDRLPSKDAHPPHRVAQELLVLPRGKFRHPVILAARRRGHGGHLGHGQVDEGEADPGDEIHPDIASSPAVGQPNDAKTEDGFPRLHKNHREAEN
ncbi:hypothetical protein PG990_010552 [Apiospora arundinis]